MRADWEPLRKVLAAIRRDGRSLSFWWRDDDAVAPTPELDQLAQLADKTGMRVALAVIPGLAEDGLGKDLADPFDPVVHGWRHENLSPEGEKKAEFGHPRPEAMQEFDTALDRLRALFGDRLTPMFVPPWNRFDTAYAPALQTKGYKALSTFGPRSSRQQDGLLLLNTHVDPIFWRGDRGLVPLPDLIPRIASDLDAWRRREDISEPIGYLTHHLVHTPEIWEFSHAFCCEMLDGGARPTTLKDMIP